MKENLHVRFHKHPVLMGVQSRNEGRPIYQDFDYIEIQVPGQKNQVVNRKVRDADKKRFPAEWNNYKEGKEDVLVGTPIDHLPGISPSTVLELKILGVHTVEQMSSVAETGIQKIGHGARDLQERAKAYLGQSSRVDQIKEENSALKEQINQLNVKLNAIMSLQGTKKQPAKKKAGRPRKKVA